MAVFGGAQSRVARATAEQLLNAVDDRQGLQRAFDALPGGAQSAVIEELALHPGHAGAASEHDLARFAATPEGAELVKEWRGRAARNLALLRSRLARMLARMSAADLDSSLAWFDGLSSAHAKAVLRALAEGRA